MGAVAAHVHAVIVVAAGNDPLERHLVMSWLIYIGISIRVSQSVGAYMMSSMYMCMVMSLGFIEQACGVQPLSMTC
jgi:hypothetical protein